MHGLSHFAQTYSYLFVDILFFIIWLPLFLSKRANRNEMILGGVTFGIAAMLIEGHYSMHDYWNPVFLFPHFYLEDFLYGMFFGGICAQIYAVLFPLHERQGKHRHSIVAGIVLSAGTVAGLLFALTNIFHINSIWALIFAPFLLGLYTLYNSKHTFIPQVTAGMLALLLMLGVYWILLALYPQAFIDHWYLHNLSGIMILHIPLEEYLFAFSCGFGLSMLYEYLVGIRIVAGSKR